MKRHRIEIDIHEKSTWRGIAWLAGFVVAILWPESASQALTVAAGFAGAIGLMFKDET